MEHGSVVHLGCNTPNALIYYTVDGVAPEMHKVNIKVCTRLYICYIYIFISLLIKRSLLQLNNISFTQ